MSLGRVHGVIRRRLLVNFRIDPEVAQRQLPAPFRPKLQNGSAIAGICLIRLEEIRPKRFPRLLGFSSENAAHRFAVQWRDEKGEQEGVYIPRRDTGSLMNQLAGGRLFPGEHRRARFDVADDGMQIHFAMRSSDGTVNLSLRGRESAEWPASSAFSTIDEASSFFEGGSVGFSATRGEMHLDGVALKTDHWRVSPLAIDEVHSSWFADRSRFPEGSVVFDCALVMRNIPHEWVPLPAMPL